MKDVIKYKDHLGSMRDLCDQVKKPVQKSYKGSFNVRIDPDLHKKAAALS